FAFDAQSGLSIGIESEVPFAFNHHRLTLFAAAHGRTFIGLDVGERLFHVDELGNASTGVPLVDDRSGEVAPEYGFSILALPDGGAGTAGYLLSGMNGEYAWLARLDADGEIVWQRRLEGLVPGSHGFFAYTIASPERPMDAVRALPDGRFAVIGTDNGGVSRAVILDASGALEWVSPPLQDASIFTESVAPLAIRAADDGRL